MRSGPLLLLGALFIFILVAAGANTLSVFGGQSTGVALTQPVLLAGALFIVVALYVFRRRLR